MAVKEKVDILDRKSRILEVLSKDYKWESYLFVVIALLLIEIGCLVLNSVITFKEDVPFFGSHPTGAAVTLIVIGSLSLVYALFPFIRNAFPEIRKTTWPSWTLFIGNTAKTFVFLIFFTLIYLMFDIIISELLSRLLSK